MNVLTTDSVITCGHDPAGKVTPVSTAKLTVAGFPVLLEAGVSAIGLGCVKATTSDVPCTKVARITAGRSVKLFVGGQAVLLSSLAGSTNGMIRGLPGRLTVTSVQTELGAP